MEKKMENKGLRVNVGKTKILISCYDTGSLKDFGKHPCGGKALVTIHLLQKLFPLGA